ncbi:ATP-binding cassette domain-containing protein [Numidum massiliense]|uniref:ATP-binding cassette domain-containing protein n=1 Tax=Numidum massiliense TaxID=1522315 RepID=UPI0006D54B15|nr:ABC transporter ATP-binding protein [Numidum massiliense]
MIQLEHVTKTYLTKVVVDDVTATFPTGKIVGVIGENGSGKSTLLKLMAGLIRPSKGTVTISGRPATRRISDTVAYLSESETLYRQFTIAETVNFFASQFRDFNLQKATELMHFMQLDPQKKVSHLSKGHRGRLKMALVLARDVPVILLDEPLSGLDQFVRSAIVESLLSFLDLEKQTVILTTHELMELETILDVVVAIRAGKIVAMSDVETVREVAGQSLVAWLKNVYETKTNGLGGRNDAS